MTEFESQVMERLDSLHAMGTATQTAVEALAGPLGRVTKIEEKQTREEWKVWIFSAVGPVLLGIRELIHRLSSH